MALPKRHKSAIVSGSVLLAMAALYSQMATPSSVTAPLSKRQSVALPTSVTGEQGAVRVIAPTLPTTPTRTVVSNSTPLVPSAVPSTTATTATTAAQPTPAVATAELASGNGAVANQSSEPEPVIDANAPTYQHRIEKGDTLSALFDRFAISQQQMLQVLEADYEVLALDTLMPDDILYFWVDGAGQLTKFEIEFDRARQVVFNRVDDTFSVERIEVEGHWRAHPTAIEIRGSFERSATKAGLSLAQAQQISQMFKDKLDFRRQLRAGDKVRVLHQYQSIDGEATGNWRLMAVEFEGRNWLHTAYLHDDGSYYDADGNSLARAFMRHPFEQTPRISSKFNPRRLHPVTGRVSPHNGTDYAARTGTPILAAGDGVVQRVENHRIAGKYVVIKHGGEYATRYLHMSRIDVKRGQTVSRGQRIGAVGATGRVTGAHLHYEFLIRGRAVNSLTAKIPMATSVPKKEKGEFLVKVDGYQKQMQEYVASYGGGETMTR
ncbi:peptidoglycan DD-metalloendopeptidase family protein [Ferrimonas senticii]|uniref:peptidoglycan DD-metalloendopeptidase family protein n=1 Tax=Ferrimonas senticii TaxID=394566 RepID=UPI000411EB31|nr:peptidoglycan DD-metalloendopeptidase family protein [Ferrimonas senticii]